MKAVVYDRYGSVDRLRLAEVPEPVPEAGQVLVRVAASAIPQAGAIAWQGTAGAEELGMLAVKANRQSVAATRLT